MTANMTTTFETIITGLFGMLGVTSGPSGLGVNDPVSEAVLDGLLGSAETTVTVADALHSGDRWVVLSSVRSDEDIPLHPVVVRAHLHPGSHLGDANWGCPCRDALPLLREAGLVDCQDQLTTTQVVEWFQGGFQPGEGSRPTWVDDYSPSQVGLKIAGDLGPLVESFYEYEDNVTVCVYDLLDVPLGGSVWQIQADRRDYLNQRRHLWVFTRRSEDRWEVTVVADVKSATTRDGRDFTSLLAGAQLAWQAMTA